jgi:TPR repeat protein
MYRLRFTAGLVALVMFASSAHAVDPKPGDILLVRPDMTKLEQAAAGGDVKAQVELANIYFRGEGVTKDEPKAIDWYRKAALKDDDWAEFSLGMIYSFSASTPHDYPQAAAWFNKSALHGDLLSAVMLGAMYEKGLGVSQSHTIAIGWLKVAADRGLAKGQYLLAAAYMTGTPEQQAQVVPLLQKAVDQGEALAQDLLGTLYVSGRLVAKDQPKGLGLLRQAAAQADLDAECRLGTYFLVTAGVSAEDKAQGRKWLQEGAAKGGPQVAECLNMEAWILATAADPARRDPTKAIGYATQAVGLAPDSASVRDTLAAAYASAGRYDEAVTEQQKALAAATSGQGDAGRSGEMQARLELYRAHKPYIDPAS